MTLIASLSCTMFALGCAGDEDPGGADEVGSDDGLESVECEAPCAVAWVRAEGQLFYQLWAIGLADPEQAGPSQVLLEGGPFGLAVDGPTPWGSLAVFSDEVEGGQTLAFDVDEQDRLVAEPLLPAEASNDFVDWQFSADGQVAIMRGGVDETWKGNGLWAAKFAEGSAETFAVVEEGLVVAAALAEDGGAVAFDVLHGQSYDRLYVSALDPDFGEPIQLTADSDDVAQFVWAGEHLIASVRAEAASDHRIDRWSLGEPMAAPATLATGAEATLSSAGGLVGYFVGAGNLSIADAASGLSVPVPVADVREHVWLRDQVLLLSVGESRALSMVALEGLVVGEPIPVTGLLPEGAEVRRALCNAQGQWCAYTVALEAEQRVEIVDLSGPVPTPSLVVLEGIDPDDEVEIVFAGSTHATIAVGDEALHVVELGSALAAIGIAAPDASGHQIRLAHFAPQSDRLLFVTRDPQTAAESLWRCRADASDVRQLGVPAGWVFERVDVLE